MSLIAFTGAAGSGKDTAAAILIEELGYEKLSFAGSLKDALSAIFGWSRDSLEGATTESRIWREEEDEWWSAALKRPVTPRKMLQEWGTEVGRNAFHPDIWLLSVQRKIEQNPCKKFVITDCRFENEAEALKALGARLIGIKRGERSDELMQHASETGLPSEMLDVVVNNDGSLDEFKKKIITSINF
jgi:dephospho-CoA kinase